MPPLHQVRKWLCALTVCAWSLSTGPVPDSTEHAWAQGPVLDRAGVQSSYLVDITVQLHESYNIVGNQVHKYR